MNPQDAIDFSREALKTCMMVGGPILVASLLIGLLVGVFQAMTQVQDQTVSFVPKILLLILMIGLCLPWLTDQMLEFAQQSFEKPMTQWAGHSGSGGLFPKQKPSTDSSTSQSVASRLPSNQTPNQTPRPASPPILNVSAPIGSTPLLDQLPNSNEIEASTPFKSPFILPHYRMSKAPKSEVGG